MGEKNPLPPSYDEAICSPPQSASSTTSSSSAATNLLNNNYYQTSPTSGTAIAPIGIPGPIIPSTPTTQIITSTAAAGSYRYNLFNATLKPYPNFNVKGDVKILFDALTNGPDKDTIITVLCHRTSDQRMEIFKAYFAYTGRYLIKDIKNQFNFNLYLLLAGLSVPYFEYLARCIHRGGSLRWLYYLLFTIPNDEVINMKYYFEAKYNRKVEKYVEACIQNDEQKSEVYLLKPLIRSLEARRNENVSVSPNEVNYDIDRLASIKPSTFGTKKDEKDILKDIFYYKNWSHIRAVCEDYHKKYNQPVFDVIKRCYTSNGDDIFCNIAKYALNKNFYFAYLLKLSMKGLGTNDLLLMHIILKRSEIDLGDIKIEFQNLYKQSLREWVRDDTSGHYKYGLYALMGEQRSS